ncbi:hypothetical protein [Streptomyces sp. ok210]|jgi:hypothetical protein|uniref:hypothetical protein n=1 Tax=Streptomyces sp. ok210 TaxID=1761905 RepID=UPI0008F054BC|nr:hypothetical protein [Streptomyces sp. ok210]SFT31434.1 hypothetical protein SAMN04487982_11970 [Streptomyces sp. ok210]
MAEDNALLEARIAARAKISVEAVREIFEAQGIPLASPPARPRPLRIHRLRLAGDRTGTIAPGHFDTPLQFSDGLTALVASNLRGKSSVLELVTWCLRGTPRERSGALHWLSEVDLDATIAGKAMGFRLNLENEEITSAVVLAGPEIEALASVRAPDAERDIVPLFRASDSDSYAEQIQALMMDWMDLHPLVSMFKGTSTQTHGWPAYFGAVYLPAGRSQALMGDHVMSGLPGRLLQVFLDLPAAAVLTKVKTSGELMATARKRRETAARAAVQERTDERRRIQRDLEQAQARLEGLPAASPDGESLTELATRAIRLASCVADSQESWEKVMQAHRRARAQRLRDAKILNDVTESATARRLFHGLDPKACPRCDQEIAADRRQQEREMHSCAVCSRPVEGDDETPEEVAAEARERLDASTADEQATKEALEEAESDLVRLSDELHSAQDELRRADAAAHVPARVSAREEVLRLEGALSVFPELPPVPDDPVEAMAIKILRAGAKELEKDHERAAEKLFSDLNKQIADLARKFGIVGLESVEIDRAGHLDVTSDGGRVRSFSAQSPGERVRLRIAVIVALLRVGAIHQVSTHPGLLLIDSPKAEEIQDLDIRSLLEELRALAKSNQLQVVITTADFDLAHEVLTDDSIIKAREGHPLW